MILITGATGMVGAHLLAKVLGKNQRVRVIYRSDAKKRAVLSSEILRDCEHKLLNVDWVQADIRDVTALESAFDGITSVYHCAGLISFNPKHYKELRTINIDGTANVVNLCIAHGVEKLCYVSSIATLGEPKTNGIVDEGCFWNPDEDHNIYAITKYGAEMEVWRASQEGVPVVVVNPGVIFGGYVPSKSMDVFDKVNADFSLYTDGGSGFVAVEDVVKAMIFLMNSEIENERFVLVSESLKYQTMLSLVAKSLEKRGPKTRITKPMLKLVQYADAIYSLFNGGSRTVDKHTVKSLTEMSYYDNSKMKSLGFEFEPVASAIQRYAVLYKKK